MRKITALPLMESEEQPRYDIKSRSSCPPYGIHPEPYLGIHHTGATKKTTR